MSEREDRSNYSSYILLSFLKEDAIYGTTLFDVLNKYRSLYFSYQQKCEETHPLFWYIFEHRKSISPITIYKKIVYRRKIKVIYDIVQKLVELERTKAFQDILNKNSNGYVIDIYSQAIKDGYIKKFNLKK